MNELVVIPRPVFERSVRFKAAYDKRSTEPGKNYGIHGVHIYFEVKCDGEGLTFSVSTNWQLPHVQVETDRAPRIEPNPLMFHKPQAFGVDGHWKKPRYEGQKPIDGCSITGGDCYCDGSALLGEDFLQTLIEGGDEALFARMEQQFIDWSH